MYWLSKQRMTSHCKTSGQQTIFHPCTEPWTSFTVTVYVAWTSKTRHLEETTWKRPMQRERERREDYVIPIPYWTTPTFIKHSRAPWSDSTPDVFEGGKKDHLCRIKVNIKTIFILIIHQQKCVARRSCPSVGSVGEMSEINDVWCQRSRSESSSVWPHVLWQRWSIPVCVRLPSSPCHSPLSQHPDDNHTAMSLLAVICYSRVSLKWMFLIHNQPWYNTLHAQHQPTERVNNSV